jgi:hypothetical protein
VSINAGTRRRIPASAGGERPSSASSEPRSPALLFSRGELAGVVTEELSADERVDDVVCADDADEADAGRRRVEDERQHPVSDLLTVPARAGAPSALVSTRSPRRGAGGSPSAAARLAQTASASPAVVVPAIIDVAGRPPKQAR